MQIIITGTPIETETTAQFLRQTLPCLGSPVRYRVRDGGDIGGNQILAVEVEITDADALAPLMATCDAATR